VRNSIGDLVHSANRCPVCTSAPHDHQMRPLNPGSETPPRCTPGILGRPVAWGLALGLAVSFGLGTAPAQEHKRKVPGLDKITTGGTNQQAFSGKVQSVDLERSLLNVNTVQGGVTEIFPVKKTVHVMTASGDRLRLGTLKPGTNVIVYYEQKGDRRTVKQIVVLAAAPREEKKSPPPS
jgi:hypothetical protein